MIGRRVYPDDKGNLPHDLQPGQYGRATHPYADRLGMRAWTVCAPNGDSCTLSPTHSVVEHEDGSVTVTPSILMEGHHWKGWHGWLRHGVWSSA